MDESRRAAQTGASGETRNRELAVFCEAANRILDQLAPVMQSAHEEGARLYNEIRNRALAGEKITKNDADGIGALIKKWRVAIFEDYVKLASQDAVVKSDFIDNLLQMRVHRMDTLPFGGVSGTELTATNETPTYQDFLDEYLKDGDISHLQLVSDFQISQLYVTPESIKKTDNLQHCIKTASFAVLGRREGDIKTLVDFPENVVATDSYEWFDWEIFIEIFKNAEDAMPDGGEIKVEAKITDDKEYISISISDTGCGMSQETLKKVMGGGFTTKTTGTGRGLGLVRKYIEQIVKGEFKIESHEGKGTIITVVMPLAKK